MNTHETMLKALLPRGQRVYSVATCDATWGSTAHFYVVREDDLCCIDNLLVNVLGEPYSLYRRNSDLFGVRMTGPFRTVRIDLIEKLSQLLHGEKYQLVHCNLTAPLETHERIEMYG